VTTSRADVMYLVTAYGIASPKGKSVPERAQALIALAHPDFRESLERDGRERRLIPRGFFRGVLRPRASRPPSDPLATSGSLAGR
jgi:acyl-CoA hydrolase